MERWKKESEQNKAENGSANHEENHSTNHSGAIFSHDDDIHADDEDDEHLSSPNGVKSNDNKKIKDDSPKKFSKKGKVKSILSVLQSSECHFSGLQNC